MELIKITNQISTNLLSSVYQIIVSTLIRSSDIYIGGRLALSFSLLFDISYLLWQGVPDSIFND